MKPYKCIRIRVFVLDKDQRDLRTKDERENKGNNMKQKQFSRLLMLLMEEEFVDNILFSLVNYYIFHSLLYIYESLCSFCNCW